MTRTLDGQLSAPRAGLRPARPPWGPRKLGTARRFLESWDRTSWSGACVDAGSGSACCQPAGPAPQAREAGPHLCPARSLAVHRIMRMVGAGRHPGIAGLTRGTPYERAAARVPPRRSTRAAAACRDSCTRRARVRSSLDSRPKGRLLDAHLLQPRRAAGQTRRQRARGQCTSRRPRHRRAPPSLDASMPAAGKPRTKANCRPEDSGEVHGPGQAMSRKHSRPESAGARRRYHRPGRDIGPDLLCEFRRGLRRCRSDNPGCGCHLPSDESGTLMVRKTPAPSVRFSTANSQ